jgi:hypothetical protein
MTRESFFCFVTINGEYQPFKCFSAAAWNKQSQGVKNSSTVLWGNSKEELEERYNEHYNTVTSELSDYSEQ